jgi:2'-5' RNA ligase
MRLFVAISLPEVVKASLAQLQQPVEGLRWQAKEQLHLTLRFIGNVGLPEAELLQKLLGQIRAPTFTYSLNGLGCFPSTGRPRVLWAGVEKVPLLMELQRTVELSCQKAGLEPETRLFTPHITLGKVKGTSVEGVQDYLVTHQDYQFTEVPATCYILYASRLHAQGAIHRPVERYALM